MRKTAPLIALLLIACGTTTTSRRRDLSSSEDDMAAVEDDMGEAAGDLAGKRDMATGKRDMAGKPDLSVVEDDMAVDEEDMALGPDLRRPADLAAKRDLAAASCSNARLDGNETDVDCGGTCPGCPDGKLCLLGTDCQSGTCASGVCGSAGGKVSFASPVKHSVYYPTSLVTGDYDGDGYPDLAALNMSGRNTVTVLHGGVAGLGRTATSVALTAPGQLATIDLDDDGVDEIACSMTTIAGVNIVKRGATGTYDRGGQCSAKYPTKMLATADFDGDGWEDLVAGGAVNSTLDQIGGDAGSCFEISTLGIVISPTSVATADLNRDGRPDAVATADSDRIVVVLNVGGKLSKVSDLTTTGKDLRKIVAADVTGDGTVDLVVAANGSHRIEIYRGKGNGTFDAPTTLAAKSSGPTSLAVGDLDGDGRPDLVAPFATSGEIGVWLNLGGGSFAAASYHSVGGDPMTVVATDLDGDGLDDVAVTQFSGNSITVLYNTTP